MTRQFRPSGMIRVLACTALAAVLSVHCGDRGTAATDATTADVEGLDASHDASLDIDEDAQPRDAHATLDAALPQADTNPNAPTDTPHEAYTLPEDSIKTCAEYLDCVRGCPPRVDSCVGPCHEAMTERAAYEVHRFMNCVVGNGCTNPDCLMRHCGREMRECYGR